MPKCSPGCCIGCAALTSTGPAASISIGLTACWRLLPVAKEPDPQEVFAAWLESLKKSKDQDQLRDIAGSAASAIESLPEEEPEQD
jgi:hypothetical protein